MENKPCEWWMLYQPGSNHAFLADPSETRAWEGIHVIEHSAYAEAIARAEAAEIWAEHKTRDADVLQNELEEERAKAAGLVAALKWYAALGDDDNDDIGICLERAIDERPKDNVTINLGGKYIAEKAVQAVKEYRGEG